MLSPVAGSPFPGGHIPRVGFFRVAQLLGSAFDETLVLFVWADAAEMVEVDDAFEAIEEEEFCR